MNNNWPYAIEELQEVNHQEVFQNVRMCTYSVQDINNTDLLKFRINMNLPNHNKTYSRIVHARRVLWNQAVQDYLNRTQFDVMQHHGVPGAIRLYIAVAGRVEKISKDKFILVADMIEIRRHDEPPATVDPGLPHADIAAEGVDIHRPPRSRGSRGCNNREASRKSTRFNPTRRNRPNQPASPPASRSPRHSTSPPAAGSSRPAQVSIVFASAGPSGSSSSLATLTPATVTNVSAPHSHIIGIGYTVSTPPPRPQTEGDSSASHSSNDASPVHEANNPDPVD